MIVLIIDLVISRCYCLFGIYISIVNECFKTYNTRPAIEAGSCLHYYIVDNFIYGNKKCNVDHFILKHGLKVKAWSKLETE